jgi:type IV pilus assembly protein PilA
MQTIFKIKLLQHLSQKDSWFSLRGWKLWRIIIILGVLGTILSSLYLSQKSGCANQVRTAEARSSIGAINRAQQAHFLDNNNFSNSIEKLDLGIKNQTQNYTYSTKATPKAVFNYAVPRRKDVSQGWFGLGKRPFYGFVGGVFVQPKKVGDKEITTVAILCQATNSSTLPPAEPTYKNGVLNCGSGTKSIP